MSETALVGADYAWEPGTKITITLVGKQTLRGIIWFADEIAVALEEARLWDGAQWVEQGEVVVPYSAIAFINRLPYKHTTVQPNAPERTSHVPTSYSPAPRRASPSRKLMPRQGDGRPRG